VLPQPPQFSGSVLVFTHEEPHVRVPTGHVMTQAPAAQRGVLPPHITGGAPHAVGSLAGFLHPPLPSETVGGRQTQALATQYSSSLHVFPGVPQFDGSRVVSTQRPPTIVRGAGHEQTPDVQVPPAKQRLPQRPQFAVSMVTSTQLDPHARRLPPQSQAPETQVAVAGHEFPHRPQLASSLETSTQLPPQAI